MACNTNQYNDRPTGSRNSSKSMRHQRQIDNQNQDHQRRRRGGYSLYNLTTHLDYDDKEILIESALGNYDSSNQHDHHGSSSLKSRKHHNSENSTLSSTSRRRRNYAPLRGYDILSDEERSAFSHPSPGSIFELPESWPFFGKGQQQYQRNMRFFRVLMIMLGVTMYFILMITIKKFYFIHDDDGISITTMNHNVKPTKAAIAAINLQTEPGETDIDIKEMTAKNTFIIL